MTSDAKRKKSSVRFPLIVLCLLCTISTLAFAVMVAQNRKVESIGDVVMSVDGRGNYLADEKRFDAQLHKSKKKSRINPLKLYSENLFIVRYVSKDLNELVLLEFKNRVFIHFLGAFFYARSYYQ